MRKLMVLVGIVLAGCATKPAVEMIYIRADGRTASQDPILAQQFELDRTACQGEMQKANLAGATFCRGMIDCAVQADQRGAAVGVVGNGCMADRGYILVPREEANERSAALRAAQRPAVAASPRPKQAKRE